MSPHRASLAAAFAILVLLPAGVAAGLSTVPRHARLTKSLPAANDTVSSSPPVIELWFSERVEPAVSRIRLTGPAGEAIGLGKVTPASGQRPPAIVAAVRKSLGAGAYVVHWTAAAEDGHVMKGEFSFVIVTRR